MNFTYALLAHKIMHYSKLCSYKMNVIDEKSASLE